MTHNFLIKTDYYAGIHPSMAIPSNMAVTMDTATATPLKQYKPESKGVDEPGSYDVTLIGVDDPLPHFTCMGEGRKGSSVFRLTSAQLLLIIYLCMYTVS